MCTDDPDDANPWIYVHDGHDKQHDYAKGDERKMPNVMGRYTEETATSMALRRNATSQ